MNLRVKLRKKWFFLVLISLLTITIARAAGGGAAEASSHDSIQPVLIAIAVLLIAAKIGADFALRVGQPPVLGELMVGVLIGNLALLGPEPASMLEPAGFLDSISNLGLTAIHSLEFIKTNDIISVLAEIGVILLLFTVGLESKLDEMLSVGLSSLVVASIGIVAPFVLGWGVAKWFLPDESVYVHVFIGATLCATSVGITARVLQDLGKIHLKESKIVLGAAVIDDIQGLIVLAVIQGIILAASGGGSVSAGSVGWIIAKSVIFLVGGITVGRLLAPRVFGIAARLRASGLLLTIGLTLCFLMAWIAGKIHLAPIVGAFTAGLLLEELHYKDLIRDGQETLESLVDPVAAFLVPIFFVLMGIRVDLLSFANTEVLGFAAVLTIAAIIGKQVCGLGVLEKGIDRLSVGLGMIPRGEVGLIFASIGMGLVIQGERIVSQNTFSAIVVMVIVTTLITPPMLRWSLNRKEKKRGIVAAEGSLERGESSVISDQ